MRSIECFNYQKDELLKKLYSVIDEYEYRSLSNELNIFYNMLNNDSLNYFYSGKVYERVNVQILKININVFQRIFNRYNCNDEKLLVYILNEIIKIYSNYFNILRCEINSICDDVTFLNKSDENYDKLLVAYALPLFSKQ
jgi:hypothetical protein